MRRGVKQFGKDMSAARALRLRRAFTLVEVLVTIVLLIVVMAAVIQIFTISSDAAARTSANSEVNAKAATVREGLTDQVGKISPGLLIIDSPTPTTGRRETQDGFQLVQSRQDRLVFLVTGDVDEFQSFTDPTRANPNGAFIDQEPRTASCSEALVYFGPGIPLTIAEPVAPIPLADDLDFNSVKLTTSEWVFLHRTIMLMTNRDASSDPAWVPTTMTQVTAAGGMLNGGPLRSEFINGSMDAIVGDAGSNYPATARTFAALIMRKNLDASDLLSENPSIAALWQPSYAPRTATLQNPALLNYYSRGGASFVPGLADFRIEWTDGGPIDSVAGDLRTRWFGLRPDPTVNVSNAMLNSLAGGSPPVIPNYAVRRQDYSTDTRADAAVAFGIAAGSQNKIEWSRNGNLSGNDSAYRAIWRGDTWQYRPKALRFTYRIYDAGNRLKQTTEIDLDEDGDFDPDEAPPNDSQRRLMMRWGRTFSVVVPVP